MTTKLYNKKILISQYRASDISRGHEIPQNSQKNAQNNVKFTRNHIKYLSVQHLWNLSWLLGLFTRHTLANLSWNFIQETSKQRFSAKFTPKIPAKSDDFSVNLSLKILWNLTFFSATYQKPCPIDAYIFVKMVY